MNERAGHLAGGKMERYAVIMAGGSGTRFWPKSRKNKPKQLLSIFTDRTLLEEAVARGLRMASRERVLVITTAEQLEATREILSGTVAEENVIAEPFGRDTAPCIALGCAAISRRDGDAVMLVMPADHVIRPMADFVRTAEAGIAAAEEEDALVTFGVKPTHAATGYGYIEAGEVEREVNGVRIRAVSAFREKPDAATAEAFLAAGNYTWNSGMFVWKVSTMRAALARHAPALGGAVGALAKALGSDDPQDEVGKLYEKLEKLSIDYAVMEKAERVLVVETDYQWNDVGSWTSARELLESDSEGNVVWGEHTGIDSSRLIVSAEEGHVVATLGVEDLVIVVTKDATLVMKASEAQRTKELVELLRERGMEDVL